MRHSLLAATSMLALAGGIGRAHATAYTFTTLQAPGSPARSYEATGINDQGKITVSNFVYFAGVFTPINVPSFNTPNLGNNSGALLTGINNNGQITGSVGSYNLVSFIDSNGVFTPLTQNIGGSSFIQYNLLTSAINDFGEVLGKQIYFSTTSPPINVSLLYDGTTLNIVNIPGLGGAGQFDANGLNNAGQIVGTNLRGSGFLDSAGVVTPINVPGASSTMPTAISNSGLIAGTFDDATGQHGFVDNNGVFSILDYPNAPQCLASTCGTFVTGINNAGDVVGYTYTANNGTEAFLATPTAVPEPGSITLLGTALAALGFAARRRHT